MLHYFNPIFIDDLVLSIDNVVLDTSISKPEIRDLLDVNISCIANGSKIEVRQWENYKSGTFHYQTTFRIDDEVSFWLGRGLNGNGILLDRCRLDWNPNKIADEPTFMNMRDFLIRNSRGSLCHIPRFDLAIDIPVNRSECFLVKDRRMYIERRHGVEFTQYLGSKSSTAGRVKLYNKTSEAGLDYALTRLELTLDPSLPYDRVNFPTVWRLNDQQLRIDGIKVTDTEKFILNSILQGYGTLNDLGRKTRRKIETLLENYASRIEIREESYARVLKQLARLRGKQNE